MQEKWRVRRKRERRMDAFGALGVLLTLLVAVCLAVPQTLADKKKKNSEGADASAPDKSVIGKLPITELSADEAILHALNRLAYGPRPGDVEHVKQISLEQWIDQQLHPDSIRDAALEKRLEKYSTLKMASTKLLEEYPPPQQAAKREGLTKEGYRKQQQEKVRDEMTRMMVTGEDDRAQEMVAAIQGPQRIIAELSMAKIERAIYSERQLEAVMQDFWFNHFNVFAEKGAVKWMLTSYEREAIRPRTMGKFEDLLVATAKSPAMLFYLDNWMSADPDAWKRHQQELMARRMRYGRVFGSPFPLPREGGQGNGAKKQERGLNENYGREVMELHTLGVDGGYTQQDVIQMAKCLTGWTIREPRRNPEFFFDDRLHTPGKKIVLGRTFNYGGERDGSEVLKMLAKHPSTAQFISTELARRFVSDTPPASLVERMAHSYQSSGGDIRAVLKTMIYSPEFWTREAYRAKVKTPLELVASTARATGADISAPIALVQWVARIGEPLYRCQPPTGYSDKVETWVNTGALLNRLNFAMAISSGHMPGLAVPLDAVFDQDTASDPQKALARALSVFLDNQVSPQTRDTLEKRLDDPQILQARLDDPVKQVNYRLISGLVLGAPEFQRR